MNTIQDAINEAISSSSFGKAQQLIRSYLRKHLSKPVYGFPETEHFRAGSLQGTGVRFFVGKQESVRFNWISDASINTSANLDSVTYWDGSRFDGVSTWNIKFDHGQSLVKVLPMIVHYMQMKSPPLGKVLYMEDEPSLVESVLATDFNVDFSKQVITEAIRAGGNAIPTIHNIIRGLSQGLNRVDMQPNKLQYGPGFDKIQDTLRIVHPEMYGIVNRKLVFLDKANAKKIDIGKLCAAMGISAGVGATVLTGATEYIAASKEVEQMEQELPRLAYEEQLGDLRRAMVLLMNGATNALFLAGRGGIGKTQTVEEELHKRGLQDGEGYFKITGSASTAGIYRLLYQHRNDIILFDDSDGALVDQDSRNLFKSASDTKKVRKISWMKAGKNYVDPADMDEEDEDPDVLPRYFDFKGKIIFISNLKLDKLDPDGALRTRAYVVNIDPTDTEVYDYMGKIVAKIKLDVDYHLTDKQRQEVIDLLRSRKQKEGSANLRQLVRGLNTMAGILKDGGIDYAGMILRYA